tara:strand:+ start:49 stop:213 length:165 start_codon:yes stop_codon:yes gene_type:complete
LLLVDFEKLNKIKQIITSIEKKYKYFIDFFVSTALFLIPDAIKNKNNRLDIVAE